MQIWELVILFCVFMIDPPRCSTSIIQQNETPLPISAVAAEPGSRVQQGHKRALNFPEGQSPLDPLSVTPVKPKRHQKGRLRRIKASQKRKSLMASADLMMDRHSSSIVQSRGSVDSTEKLRNITNPEKVEKIETPVSTDSLHTTDNIKTPPARTRSPKQSGRTSFGLPVDRLGHRRLPDGRL